MAEESNLDLAWRTFLTNSATDRNAWQAFVAAWHAGRADRAAEIERLHSNFVQVVIANAEVANVNAEQAETIERLRKALKELLDDEWRCTVDWGPRDERQAILDRCSALVGTAAAPKPLPTESAKAAPGVMDVLELQAKTDAAVARLNPLVKCPTCGMGYFKHPMQD